MRDALNTGEKKHVLPFHLSATKEEPGNPFLMHRKSTLFRDNAIENRPFFHTDENPKWGLSPVCINCQLPTELSLKKIVFRSIKKELPGYSFVALK